MDENNKVSGLPELAKSVIWMINFGYLGIQIAFTLETSQMSRIFQTLGADPTKLGWFFILPPLAGLVVQPAIGSFSDRTWAPKLGGRRLPYLLIGMIFAVIMMLFLPNIGSLGLGYGSIEALVFGAIAIAILDVAANMAMQPFKMMIGDMVNDEQKSYAYGIQSMLSNSGAVIAAFFPFLLTVLGVANTAKKGVVPQSVVISFYVGATILVITSLLTVTKVHEYDPKTYARYHGIKEEDNKEGGNWFELLKKAPNDHHKVGYGISLLLGAIGYGSIFFVHSQNILIVSFILIGISWAAMNTYPLTMVSNALSGKHMGTYLGLFNCSICLPQIIASLLSFILFPLMKYSIPAMMLTAGISGILAAVCVLFIKETYKN